MAVLKAPPKQPKTTVVQLRLDDDAREKLTRYAEFLDCSPSYVVAEALKHVCQKDKEFQTWLRGRLTFAVFTLLVLLVSLLVFLLGWIILPLRACFRRTDRQGEEFIADPLGAFIIMAFAAAFITETYLDTSIGCILTGFFISLVSAWKKPSC